MSDKKGSKTRQKRKGAPSNQKDAFSSLKKLKDLEETN